MAEGNQNMVISTMLRSNKSKSTKDATRTGSLVKKTYVECKTKLLTLMHTKKAEDETRSCAETICYCPVCSAAYSSNKLYDHVRDHRDGIITSFTYGKAFSVRVPVELGPRRLILQEKNKGVIFLLKYGVLPDQTARVLCVDCIGPPTLNKAFVYKLTVRCEEGRFSMESIPNVHTNMTNYRTSNNGFLIIPSSIGRFLVGVCIDKA